ncbi:hypothetical protein [Pseudomonas capsici]|uniref:Uncharacterized protein n=1 Tax=Pseudomonas capsici TaxID=2810614 RepID=A0ABT3C3N1_9PSED|nr:hypothetical protein [Pseudomonas capsici]MBN6715505.1 hypothetical protein [Pseudomonas capsici]MBN6720414.1 hypothetical protein [Pseudomonas capsici]MBN6725376.1 hypothetical protein [Pseudomonas capsici]MCV4270710.1 hypothetical protein [Pseudomonas capsici]MCV4280904.1 hypothetical protein [Pseudomonas capsici]
MNRRKAALSETDFSTESARSCHSEGYEGGSALDSYEYTFEIIVLTEKQKIIGGSLMFLMDLSLVVNLCVFPAIEKYEIH